MSTNFPSHSKAIPLPERDAKARASAEVKGYLSTSGSAGVRLLCAPSGQNGQPERREQLDSEQVRSVKGRVRAYLTANPGAVQLSVNQLLAVLSEQGVRAGRTTVAEALHELREQE